MNDIYEQWKTSHQPWELNYHEHGNFRWPGRENIWDEQWNNVFNFAGLSKDSFTVRHHLLDVGCGSKPVLDWFINGDKWFLDPLLEQYTKISVMKSYWAGHDYQHLISKPAEEHIVQLDDLFDFILCWNVLDHSYDPILIITNIYRYLKSDGMALIGTDLCEREHIGHPGIGSQKIFLDHMRSLFKIKKESRRGFKRCRDIALLLTK